MEEIKNAEFKLGADNKRLKAYLKYQKYEAMLKFYKSDERGINFVKSLKDPFRYAAKKAQEGDFELKEYEAFYHKVSELKQKDPNVKLDDLTTVKGREVIADIISVSQKDRGFKVADLSTVAVAKCYGLYRAIEVAQGRNNLDVIKILQKYQVPIGIYENALKKIENYQKNNRQELYDRVRKEKSDDMIHVVAAALEIGPGEAEESLLAFEMVKGNYYQTEFNKNIRIRQEEVPRNVLDAIIMDDRLTDDQKKQQIDIQYNKVMEINKFKEGIIKQWTNKGKDVRSMPEDFMERNGIVILNPEVEDERGIG